MEAGIGFESGGRRIPETLSNQSEANKQGTPIMELDELSFSQHDRQKAKVILDGMLNGDEFMLQNDLQQSKLCIILNFALRNIEDHELMTKLGSVLLKGKISGALKNQALDLFVDLDVRNLARENWSEPWIKYLSEYASEDDLMYMMCKMHELAGQGNVSGYEHLLAVMQNSSQLLSESLLVESSNPDNNLHKKMVLHELSMLDKQLSSASASFTAEYSRSVIGMTAFVSILYAITGTFEITNLPNVIFTSAVLLAPFKLVGAYIRSQPFFKAALNLRREELEMELEHEGYNSLIAKSAICLRMKRALTEESCPKE